MWVAVCQGEICYSAPDKKSLEKLLYNIAQKFPSLFCKDYLAIMPEKEYKEEFGIN